MSSFEYVSPSVAHHQSVTDVFASTLADIQIHVPAGPDRDAAVEALATAAQHSHLALDVVPAVSTTYVQDGLNPPVRVPVSPSPVASEGSTVDAGVAQVAGPPPAPAAPAPVTGVTAGPEVVYVPLASPTNATIEEALASYPPGYPSDVIREQPGEPKPGT